MRVRPWEILSYEVEQAQETAVNQRSQQSIETYLRQSDVQERIWKSIQEARENVTVTISRAASLFGFSESKLREWDKRGLLQTERSNFSQDAKGSPGHRQYSSTELDKLAIIRELINQGGYGTGDIPPDVDKLWEQIVGRGGASISLQGNSALAPVRAEETQHLPIDKRVDETDREEFWRYFVSQALRISLMLICEDVPDTGVAGLILPLQNSDQAHTIKKPDELHQAGLSLVGWLGKDRSFYSFLDDTPTFEYPSDFRLERLSPLAKQAPDEGPILSNVFIVIQRKAGPLSLSPELTETIRRLLGLVYAHINDWKPAFDYGRHDWLYQVHDLTGAQENTVFNNLMEMVVELGKKTSDGSNCWHFAALLLPRDASLPIQQQILVVRAQTQHSPYKVGETIVNPAITDSLALKAFQSGQIISFAQTLPGESMIEYQLPAALARGSDMASPHLLGPETTTRSALAVPVIGEYGISSAVVYIASNKPEAFSSEDQRVLRIITRMIEELLLTSQARHQVTGRLGNFIKNPGVVDATFQQFASETEFIQEIETLLRDIQEEQLTETGEEKEGLSIVSVDIDNQSSIAIKYGNRAARNLSQQMGFRIRGQMRFSDKYASGKLFHISADKHYLLVRISLEEARVLAQRLKEGLQGDYRIHPSYAIPGRAILPGNMLEISNVTAHLGITSYTLKKLRELLDRYPADVAVKKVRVLIVAGIEEVLETGKSSGGNTIISWYPEERQYREFRQIT